MIVVYIIYYYNNYYDKTYNNIAILHINTYTNVTNILTYTY